MSAVEIRPNEPRPEFGPAMRALPPRWQKAATALFITKGDRTKALRLAGYNGNPNGGGIKVTAHGCSKIRACAQRCASSPPR